MSHPPPHPEVPERSGGLERRHPEPAAIPESPFDACDSRHLKKRCSDGIGVAGRPAAAFAER